MTRQPERAGPQAASDTPRKTSTTAASTAAGHDPATKPKKFRISGTDTTSGKKVTILSDTDFPTGSIASGIDEATGLAVTLKVAGRDPAT